jgi:hypothetical protein
MNRREESPSLFSLPNPANFAIRQSRLAALQPRVRSSLDLELLVPLAAQRPALASVIDGAGVRGPDFPQPEVGPPSLLATAPPAVRLFGLRPTHGRRLSWAKCESEGTGAKGL